LSNLDKLWTPKKLRQVKIRPGTSPESFTWKCPNCVNINEILKTDIGDNKSYSCWNCYFTFTIGTLSDEIRHYIEDIKGEGNYKYQPRIKIK
jgi:hypothetical protein